MWWLALALAAEPAAVEAQRGGSLTVDDLFPPCARTYAVTKRPFADARASSSLSEGSMTHGPSRAVDGDPATAWVEGVKGAGVGETLRVAVPGGVGLPAGLWVLHQPIDLRPRGKAKKIPVRAVEAMHEQVDRRGGKQVGLDALIERHDGVVGVKAERFNVRLTDGRIIGDENHASAATQTLLQLWRQDTQHVLMSAWKFLQIQRVPIKRVLSRVLLLHHSACHLHPVTQFCPETGDHTGRRPGAHVGLYRCGQITAHA